MPDISAMLGEQPLIDESTLPDSGTTDADLENASSVTHELSIDLGTQTPPSEDPAPTGRQQRVPLQALQEERTRRQELQEQLNQQAQLNQQMQQRFQQFMERMAPPAPEAPKPEPIPAFIDDPEGHVRGITAAYEQQRAQMQAQIDQLMGHTQQQTQHQQLINHVSQQEMQYRQQVPDYNQATEFLIQRKTAEYAAYGATPEQIQQAISRDYLQVAQIAAAQGKSAPELLYNLAKAIGYQAPTATTQQPAAQPAKQTLKQAPTTLATMGGSPHIPDQQGELTLEALANMSDADFDKMFDSMARQGIQRPRY